LCAAMRRLAVGIYQYSNMATQAAATVRKRGCDVNHALALSSPHLCLLERGRGPEARSGGAPFAKKIARSHAMTKIIFITSPNSHGENGQGPGLTLSQRVRTCVSVNWLHSFNCSIHWSRSFVVALSSIAVVVEEKVSSIFVDSILTAFL